VSFYHLVELSTLIQLLTVTDYGESLYQKCETLPPSAGRKLLKMGRAAGCPGLHCLLILPLVTLTFLYSVTHFPRFCDKFGEVHNFSAPYLVSWNLANLWRLVTSFVLEVYLVGQNCKWWDVGEKAEPEDSDPQRHFWIRQSDPFMQNAVFAITTIMASESTVSWLQTESNEVDASWSTGQIITLTTVIANLAALIGEYLLAPVVIAEYSRDKSFGEISLYGFSF
jgi:hypothetical protein